MYVYVLPPNAPCRTAGPEGAGDIIYYILYPVLFILRTPHQKTLPVPGYIHVYVDDRLYDHGHLHPGFAKKDTKGGGGGYIGVRRKNLGADR